MDNKGKKWIFVDFDDTLCLHTSWRPITEDCLRDPREAAEILFCYSKLNIPVYQYLLKKQAEGNTVCLISQASNIMLEVKKCWLSKHCPDLQFARYISIARGENTKADIMRLFQKYYHLDKSDILLIDDKSAERWEAEGAGFKSANPQLIANKYYENGAK